jgi:uncharacterized membrane protein
MVKNQKGMRYSGDTGSMSVRKMEKTLKKLRTVFVAGVLVMVPAVVTVLALRFLFLQLDGLLGPWLSDLLGHDVPGLGFLATGVLVLLVGLVATNYFGRRVITAAEGMVTRLPFVRRIYKASKEIVEAMSLPKNQLFREVVTIEYPRRGVYAYGFVTSYTTRHGSDGPHAVANVYLPNPPVPTSGVLLAVPRDELLYLDISVEEALKLIISAGLVAPKDLHGGPRPFSHPTEGPTFRDDTSVD